MDEGIFQTFGICHLETDKSANDLLTADRFKGYLDNNPHLQVVHRHSFYHLLYFTEGEGEHVIDFVRFPVKKGMIYFMRPGQVHKWEFSGPVDGYIVNFSPLYFEQMQMKSQVLGQFPFFGTNVLDQVIELSEPCQKEVTDRLEMIIREHEHKHNFSMLMIAALLIEVFITIARERRREPERVKVNYNYTILKNFQDLLESHFKTIKLPKQYAALLYVTPNHLNAICKDLLGLPVGEVIRNRIVLEAKRLLVNKDMLVGDVAVELNFPDSSYFVKFFKKYTGTTPESFRNLSNV